MEDSTKATKIQGHGQNVAAQKPVKPIRKLVPFSQLQSKRVDWLWRHYMPLHEVSMVFSKGGIGKGHLTSELVARLTTGRPLPGEKKEEARPPMTVLMLRSEDDTERVVKPQLQAAGADLSRVLPVPPFKLDDKGIKELEQLIEEYGADVVTIDPIVYYIGADVNTDKANHVRAALQPLIDLSQRHKVTILLVAHQRKGRGESNAEAVMGSADFVNAVRSVMTLDRLPDGQTVFKHYKSNMGRIGPSYSFTIEEAEVELDDGSMAKVGHFVFGEEYSDLPVRRGRPAVEGNAAEAFLKTVLANGPIPATELIKLAGDEGISKRTLDRAKKDIAESFWSRGNKMFMWRLVGATLH